MAFDINIYTVVVASSATEAMLLSATSLAAICRKRGYFLSIGLLLLAIQTKFQFYWYPGSPNIFFNLFVTTTINKDKKKNKSRTTEKQITILQVNKGNNTTMQCLIMLQRNKPKRRLQETNNDKPSEQYLANDNLRRQEQEHTNVTLR